MIQGLLQINPCKRLTIPQSLSHAWLKETRDDSDEEEEEEESKEDQVA
jgi:hypothetical protein